METLSNQRALDKEVTLLPCYLTWLLRDYLDFLGMQKLEVSFVTRGA